MDTFLKPFSKDILKVDIKPAKYPYSDEYLKSQPIFPLIIFDGGAFFLIQELMGAKDPYSRELFEFISSGDLFKHWEKDGSFDWNLYYKLSVDSKLQRLSEQNVWLNRLYFLLPLAQEFLVTGDEKWAQEWYKWLTDWIDKHPYEELDDRPKDKTNGYWRDMQVAWRLLNLLHSVKMLAGSKYLDKNRWETIYSCIKLHADHMLKEGYGHISTEKAHNHVLQIGLVLLMTGVLFPEFPDAEAYAKAGRKIIEINMENAILDDGGSIEGCPSYSHFIARMYVETYLFLEKNGLPAIPGLLECINNQYTWLYQMMAPTGKTLQIGDSYAFNAEKDIEIVKSLMKLDLPQKKCSTLLKTSRFASLRNDSFDVFIDAMDRTQGHQHFGRPHAVAFYNGKPLLVDTGCSVYDRKDFRAFFSSAEAHNTVIVTDPDTSEILSDDPDKSIDVTGCDLSGKNPWIAFETKAKGFTWKRKVSLEGSRLIIKDSVNSDKPLISKVMLHFAPRNARLVSSHEAALFFNLKEFNITIDGSQKGFKMEERPAMNDDNDFFYSTVLSACDKGTQIDYVTTIQ